MKVLICLCFAFTLPKAFSMVPNDAYTFDFNIKTIEMEISNEDKIYESTELLKRIFSSPEFRKKILKHQFEGHYAFDQNQGLTNAQIYRKILAGAEKLMPENNNMMDVEIELYTNMESNVLGYTKSRTKRIWMNTKYFYRHTPGELAAHLTHEWLHKLGFDHEKQKTPNRRYSVPYAVGYIVKELAEIYSY